MLDAEINDVRFVPSGGALGMGARDVRGGDAAAPQDGPALRFYVRIALRTTQQRCIPVSKLSVAYPMGLRPPQAQSGPPRRPSGAGLSPGLGSSLVVVRRGSLYK